MRQSIGLIKGFKSKDLRIEIKSDYFEDMCSKKYKSIK